MDVGCDYDTGSRFSQPTSAHLFFSFWFFQSFMLIFLLSCLAMKLL